jgi:hypothetical protein
MLASDEYGTMRPESRMLFVELARNAPWQSSVSTNSTLLPGYQSTQRHTVRLKDANSRRWQTYTKGNPLRGARDTSLRRRRSYLATWEMLTLALQPRYFPTTADTVLLLRYGSCRCHSRSFVCPRHRPPHDHCGHFQGWLVTSGCPSRLFHRGNSCSNCYCRARWRNRSCWATSAREICVVFRASVQSGQRPHRADCDTFAQRCIPPKRG